MTTTYKSIGIYIKKNGDLIIFPEGVSVLDGGLTSEQESPHFLDNTYSDDLLEQEVFAALEEWDEKLIVSEKGATPIEKALKIRGYKKATKDLKYLFIHYIHGEGYRVVPTENTPRLGFAHLVEDSITLGENIHAGDLAVAIRKVIERSQ